SSFGDLRHNWLGSASRCPLSATPKLTHNRPCRWHGDTPVQGDRRQGERSDQVFRAAVAQAVVLSVWQTLQALGIFRASVWRGVTKWKVWLRTFTSAMVCSIFGM